MKSLRVCSVLCSITAAIPIVLGIVQVLVVFQNDQYEIWTDYHAWNNVLFCWIAAVILISLAVIMDALINILANTTLTADTIRRRQKKS